MGKSLRNINISSKFENERPDAVTLFTDRTDPQEAFERKFALIDELRESAFGVICYYGIGGIGKTSLMNRLMRLMKHHESVSPVLGKELNGYCVCFDFGAEGISIDKLTVLKSFRNQLVKEIDGISFYLFDTARALYYKKLGIDFSEDAELSSVIDQSVWLKTAVNAVGAVPVVGWVSNLLQAIDVAATDIYGKVQRGRIQKLYEKELSEMYALEAAELLARMHKYFAKDMEAAVYTVMDRPVVFFLDTYEEFVDTLKNDTVKVISDYWLRRGPESLIQSIPGALWVITGREKLDWRKDDDFWGDEDELSGSDLSEEDKERQSEELLEQHLLGDLSRADARSFFDKAGISDEDLTTNLYELTHGTPIYLDLCVERYYSICAEREPVVEDFGKDIDELVNRYLKNMPDIYRKMACVFALLGSWTDETAFAILTKTPLISEFNENRYREFLTHSFVIKSSDGDYYLHDTVRRACEEYSDKSLKEKVYNALREYSRDSLEDNKSLRNIADLMRVSVNKDTEYEIAYGTWKDIKAQINDLELRGDYDSITTVLRNLYSKLNETFRDSGYRYIVGNYYAYWLCRGGRINDGRELLESMSNGTGDGFTDVTDTDAALGLNMRGGAYDLVGDREKGLRLSEKAYELIKDNADENEDILRIKHGYGIMLVKTSHYDTAKVILESVFKKRKALLGEGNIDTLKTEHALASILRTEGDYEGSLAMFKELYELRKKYLGEWHPSTMGTFVGMSILYTKMGRNKEALEIDLKVYDFYKNNFGELHPKTIDAVNYIAIDYVILRDIKKAYEYKKIAYEGYKAVYGEDNQNTLNILGELKNLSARMGNYN